MRSLGCIVLCGALACSAPRKGAADTSGHVVDVKALPREHAELLAAYAEGGETWESARERALGEPKLTRFLVENLTLEMVKAHRALGGGDTARARRAGERAQRELTRIGAPAVPTLVGFVEVADAVSATLAVEVLAKIGRAAVEPLATLLDSAGLETRRRALSGLARMPYAGVGYEPTLRARLIAISADEPEWMLRAQCANTLGARGARDVEVEPWRMALQACLADADAAVAEAAARALIVLGDQRAAPALIEALGAATRAGDVRRFQAVERALVALSGLPQQSNLAAWREWWDSHRERVEGRRPR